MEQIARLAQDPNASLVENLGKNRTIEQQVPIIDALVNDKEGQFQVNVPNRGALPGVPDDIVVEIPAVVNKEGIHRIQVDPLPPKIMLTQILPLVLSLERTLLAIKTGDRALLLWSCLTPTKRAPMRRRKRRWTRSWVRISTGNERVFPLGLQAGRPMVSAGRLSGMIR